MQSSREEKLQMEFFNSSNDKTVLKQIRKYSWTVFLVSAAWN